jgi:TPR repeat protein
MIVLVLCCLIIGTILLVMQPRPAAQNAAVNLPTKPPVDPSTILAKAKAGDASAQAQLGTLYAKGEGVTNDYAEAAKWFSQAAAQGNPDGQVGLGELFDAGQGVKRDLSEAIRLYRLAADQGHAGAQYNLGFLYETGHGVPQDQAQAAKWFQLAAERGEPLAQYDLGQRFDLGVGVAKDSIEALKWLILAANQGQPDAAARRDKLKETLTRDQIAEAQHRANPFAANKALPPVR